MQELQITTSGKFALFLSDELLELGAAAITFCDAEDNPIFEPAPETLPLWPSIKLLAIFEEEIQLDILLLQLSATVDPESIQSAQVVEIEEHDWVSETQALTQAMCFGDNLWIYPSWDAPPDDDRVKILLDPGLAFGTGTHPTTSLMLTWLAMNPPVALRVLDYGCGSGILAIAAKKLGASSVLGVDIDPQALLATQENAARNDIILQTFLPEDLEQKLQVDLILANILAEPLLQLVPRFVEYLKPGGLIVISGILAEQVAMISDVYTSWCELVDVLYQEEWACMVWRKE